MYNDSRLVNAASNFCLCSSCSKSDIREGVICPIHEEFMKMTETLKIAGPIFACGEFKELEGVYNFLDQYYDGNKLSTEKSMAEYYEHTAKTREEWKAQKKIWAKENV
jgi:hypothetical protein